MSNIRVSAGIVTHNHKVLLFLRDNKPTIPDPDKWSLIGGHVEEGETFDEGLLREIEEEISVRPQNFKLLFQDIGYKQEEIYIYHVFLSEEEFNRIKLGDEGQKIQFFSFDEMGNLPLTTNLDYLYYKYHDVFKSLI